MNQDEKIANMTFASIYPYYVQKIKKKGRTKEELEKVISWLTGYNHQDIENIIQDDLNFKNFFNGATLHPNSKLITGTICGVKIADIDNPITKRVRYLDKLVDELAKGKELNKIFRNDS